MDTQSFSVVIGSVAAILGAYHTIIVLPKSRRDEIFFTRLRELEQNQIKMKAKLDGLNDLPNAIIDLKDTINDLKVEIATRK